MIERVARAIWSTNKPKGAPAYDDLSFPEQDIVEHIAVACIRAMKDPTDTMTGAVRRANVVQVTGESNYYRDIWGAMIDAALEEE